MRTALLNADDAAADAAGRRSGGASRRSPPRIISGGESVGKDLHEWGIGALQAPINELFGQTECNLVLGSNAAIMP